MFTPVYLLIAGLFNIVVYRDVKRNQYHLPVKYGSDELLERIGGSNAVETVVVTVVVTIILVEN